MGLAVITALVLTCTPLAASAATTTSSFSVASTPKLIITEVQTTGDTASQEFVEFYNLTDSDIDLADSADGGQTAWKLQFFSAANTAMGKPDWTKPSVTLALTGTVPAHDYFLLSSTGYAPGGIESDQVYNARLSDTGGGLQLVTANAGATVVYDRLMWKQVNDPADLPAGVLATPPARGSLQRMPNDDSEYLNADNTLTDFSPQSDISPKDIWQAPVPVTEPDAVPTEEDEVPAPIVDETDATLADASEPVPAADLRALAITELLPNPASPQSDDHDEFIELFNPNDTVASLKGYTIEVGTATLHDFTITTDVLIQPQSFLAVYSADTGLSLANSGGQARLIDPTGAVISQTPSYSAADDGMAWAAADDGSWQWTTTPTPNAANVISVAVAAVKVSPVKTTKTTTKKTAVKTTSAKVKGVSSTKAKKTVSKAKKATKPKITAVAATAPITPQTPIHTQILVAVGALAVLYAAYEYRSDISNRFYKLRHHRRIRKLLRSEAEGRRSLIPGE